MFIKICNSHVTVSSPVFQDKYGEEYLVISGDNSWHYNTYARHGRKVYSVYTLPRDGNINIMIVHSFLYGKENWNKYAKVINIITKNSKLNRITSSNNFSNNIAFPSVNIYLPNRVRYNLIDEFIWNK